MQVTKRLRSRTITQLAVALVLLVTFSTGLIVGRHIANETRNSPENTATRVSGPHFPYQLDQPMRKLVLPDILSEASAISYMDERHVAIIQDELGTLFICSIIDGHITREIPFASSGDYEGLAVHDDEAWVLRSDGTLFRISGLTLAEPQTTYVNTGLKSKDDTEGLAYDESEHQLMIGLKEAPKLEGKRRKGKRAVYGFALDNERLSDTPVLLLDMAELKRVYGSQVAGNKPQKFDPGRKSDFQPSDLAVHPITGHIYHIAARGQLLVVSDRSGQIYFVRDLPKSVFRQPEGISFDRRGNMFIVSEGAGSKGMMLEFRYEPLAPANPPATGEAVTRFGVL